MLGEWGWNMCIDVYVCICAHIAYNDKIPFFQNRILWKKLIVAY